MKLRFLPNLRLTITVVAVVFGLCHSSQAVGPDLYVADSLAGSIFEFRPDGTRTTFAIGLQRMGGLAIDSSGDLFVSESDTGTIYKYDPFGVQSVFATGLKFPIGLTFDSLGNLFAVDFGTANFFNPDGTIYEFTPTGTRSTFATGLYAPFDLAFSPTGDLFVSDYGAGRIYEFDPLGVETLFATVERPTGLAFDAAGYLYAANGHANGSRMITKFNAMGMGTVFADNLYLGYGLAFDVNGNLFDAEGGSGQILKFDGSGNSSVFTNNVIEPVALAFGPASMVDLSVPEPSTCGLVLLGAGISYCAGRRRRKQPKF